MAEVFGFRIDDFSGEAVRHRKDRLCPFQNKVPNCTKDKVSDPLGVCSIYSQDGVTITCPVRFRESWKITSDAAEFFFPSGTQWTAIPEVRLNDANGKSAGNIDVVLIAYDERGIVTDFGSLEVQAVYISGNVRNPFATYMRDPEANAHLDWRRKSKYPRADFLSSSRKRLAPQLIYKGGILHYWKRKMAVAVDRLFFAELPELPPAPPETADVAWFVYDLIEDERTSRRQLTKIDTVYTQFAPALARITNPDPGPEAIFLNVLQQKLNEQKRTLSLFPEEVELAELFDDSDLEVDED
jgi:hypothetical protein